MANNLKSIEEEQDSDKKKYTRRKSSWDNEDYRMSNTTLLIFLVNKLFEAGIRWKGSEELFNLLVDNKIPLNRAISIPKEKRSKEKDAPKTIKPFPDKKDYSKAFTKGKKGWLNPESRSNINDAIFFKQVIQTFHLYEGDTFNDDILYVKQKEEQENLIERGVELYIKERAELEDIKEQEKEDELKEKILDSFDLTALDSKSAITEEEKSEVTKIKGMSKEELKEYFHKNRKNLSQEFILKVIPSIYMKGHYQILVEDWINSLHQNHRQSMNIRKIEAHSLGSKEVAKYKESFDLLKNVGNIDNIEELIDLRTSAISNIRRYKLQDCNTEEELKDHLLVLKEYYEKMFNANEINHYYPGINLAYILAIGQIVFPTDKSFKYKIVDIKKLASTSIEIDSKSNNLFDVYYAKMSDCEFMMLSNNGLFEGEMLDLLESEFEKVEVSDISRTLRQLEWFVEIVNKFTKNTQYSIYINSEKAIKAINDYFKNVRF